VRRYAGGGAALEAELYRMSDADAALGVYLSRCGRETPDAALPTRHTVGRLQLLLVRERFLLVLTGDPERPPDRTALLAFAGAVADRLPPPVEVAAPAWLPAAGQRRVHSAWPGARWRSRRSSSWARVTRSRLAAGPPPRRRTTTTTG